MKFSGFLFDTLRKGSAVFVLLFLLLPLTFINSDTVFLFDGNILKGEIETLRGDYLYLRYSDKKVSINKNLIEKAVFTPHTGSEQKSVSIIRKDGIRLTGNLLIYTNNKILISRVIDNKLLDIPMSSINALRMQIPSDIHLYEDYNSDSMGDILLSGEMLFGISKDDILRTDFYDFFWEKYSHYFNKFMINITWDLMDFYHEREQFHNMNTSLESNEKEFKYNNRVVFLERILKMFSRYKNYSL